MGFGWLTAPHTVPIVSRMLDRVGKVCGITVLPAFDGWLVMVFMGIV